MPLVRMSHAGAAVPTTLAADITAGSSSILLAAFGGWPTGAGGPFGLVLDPGNLGEEKVLCSLQSGGTVTVASSGRGQDGTTAVGHSAGVVIEHCLFSAEVDDDNAHIYDLTRDDHLRYAPVDGSRHFTGLTTFNAGIVVTGPITETGNVAITGNETVSGTLGVGGTLGVTGAVTGSSTIQGTALAATAAGTGRYVGSTHGAPTTGTYNAGDFANDPINRSFWICTTGGTPGTWEEVGNPSMFAGGSALAGSPPSIVSPFLLQAATSVPTASAGAFTIAFPAPFPNGVLTIVCSGASTGAAIVIGPASCTVSSFSGTALTAGGAGSTGAVRINWIALGW